MIHYADIYKTDGSVLRVSTFNNEPATVSNLNCITSDIYTCVKIVADDGRVLKNRYGDISPNVT